MPGSASRGRCGGACFTCGGVIDPPAAKRPLIGHVTRVTAARGPHVVCLFGDYQKMGLLLFIIKK